MKLTYAGLLESPFPVPPKMSGREWLESVLTEMEFQELDDTLHNYRTWPASDPAGTVERFNEVLEMFARMMQA